MTPLIQVLKQHIIPFFCILFISIIYFFPQLSGKAVLQPDNAQSYKSTKESWDYYAEKGERNLWTNAIFSGMPTHQSGGLENKNIFQPLSKATTFLIKKPIGLFLFGALSMYILLVILGANTWLSMMGAIAFGFSTQFIILYAVGHNSKLEVLSTMPLIIAGAYSLFKRKYNTGALLLTLGVGLNIYQNHYQMTYYIAIFMALYYLFEVIQIVKAKDFDHLKKVALYTLIPILLALGCSMTRVMTTIDYLPESTRGNTIVAFDKATGSTDLTNQGINWEFATRFSFGLLDVGSMIVPRFAGGGGKEEIKQGSTLAQAIVKSSYPRKNTRTPTYFGNQPFTEGPPYIGIVIFLFFLFGMITMKSKWRLWAAICVGFSVIYAMGSSLGWFHKFLFEFIPLFDKFRAPSSILSAAVIFFPLMAVLTLQRLIDTTKKKDFLKPTLYIFGGASAFLGFMYIAGPSFIDMTHANDMAMTNAGVAQSAIIEQRVDFFRADIMRALALTLASGGLLYFYLKGQLKSGIFTGLIVLIGLYDIISVDTRYLDYDMFSLKKNEVGQFQPTAADLEILKDKDPHYRVFDFSSDPFQSSDASFFHKSLGGYHAAKLRRYQDIIDFHLSKGSTRVASMLNAKYFIRKGENGEKTSERNPMALGNAWFVEYIQYVNDSQTEIAKLETFEPTTTAIVHKEFQNYLQGLDPTLSAQIRLTSYSPDELTYQYSSSRENLAVFSEVYYGPNKGWQAYIDDKPVDHIRINYILRGLRVPAGTHTVRFKFDPQSYRIGENISLIFSILCGLVLIYFGYRVFMNMKERLKSMPELARKKKRVKVTSSSRRKKKTKK